MSAGAFPPSGALLAGALLAGALGAGVELGSALGTMGSVATAADGALLGAAGAMIDATVGAGVSPGTASAGSGQRQQGRTTSTATTAAIRGDIGCAPFTTDPRPASRSPERSG